MRGRTEGIREREEKDNRVEAERECMGKKEKKRKGVRE